MFVCCPHAVEGRNDHGQVGHRVPELGEVVGHLERTQEPVKTVVLGKMEL